jgi:polyhydroxyalkanoate synthase
MRDQPAKNTLPANRSMLNAQNAIVGLRGRDLFSTLRSLVLQGVKQPIHSARHVAALGGQLGRVLLGEKPFKVNPHDPRFADPTWRDNPLYSRSLQAYLACQKQLNSWIDESNLDADDRARARFIATLLGDALAPTNTLLNPLVIKELFNTGGSSLLKGASHLIDDLVNNDGMPSQVSKHAFEVGRNPWCFAVSC